MDQKIVLELDRKVADQQSILEKAGVIGFYVIINLQVSVLGLFWYSLGELVFKSLIYLVGFRGVRFWQGLWRGVLGFRKGFGVVFNIEVSFIVFVYRRVNCCWQGYCLFFLDLLRFVGFLFVFVAYIFVRIEFGDCRFCYGVVFQFLFYFGRSWLGFIVSQFYGFIVLYFLGFDIGFWFLGKGGFCLQFLLG